MKHMKGNMKETIIIELAAWLLIIGLGYTIAKTIF